MKMTNKTHKVEGGFLSCRCSCYDRKEHEITGKEITVWLKVSIELLEVEAVREILNEDDAEEDGKAMVYLKSGMSFLTDVEYEEMCKIWIIERTKKGMSFHVN